LVKNRNVGKNRNVDKTLNSCQKPKIEIFRQNAPPKFNGECGREKRKISTKFVALAAKDGAGSSNGFKPEVQTGPFL